MLSARPLIAAFPKMLLPFVVIMPGLIALAMTHMGGEFSLPLKPDGRMDYDMTLPSMLAHFYPTGLLGVGLTALLASFMSGMAGNVTAFNSVWTYDIYQAYFKKDATDAHYLRWEKSRRSSELFCRLRLPISRAALITSWI